MALRLAVGLGVMAMVLRVAAGLAGTAMARNWAEIGQSQALQCN